MKKAAKIYLNASVIICLIFSSFMAFSQQFNALLFTKTTGWHHKSIPAAIANMKALANEHHFNLVWQENASYFTDDNLANFDVVIFMMTTGNVLNAEQKAAFTRFIQSGKGFVGVHSASDTEYNWPWYQKLVGRTFKIHPPVQTATLQIVNHTFPGLNKLANTLRWTDEWYDFGPENTSNLHYLLTVDENSYNTHSDWGNNKTGDGMGTFHPISWFHEFDGGRSFYTALGHTDAVHQNLVFKNHLVGGIFWAATGKGIAK
jgi:hypothetical protein